MSSLDQVLMALSQNFANAKDNVEMGMFTSTRIAMSAHDLCRSHSQQYIAMTAQSRLIAMPVHGV